MTGDNWRGDSLFLSPVTTKMLYRSILRPLLFRLPPETAHEFALDTLSFTLSTKWARRIAGRRFASAQFGELLRFGLSFDNPVGLAAGFDKNGTAAKSLAALGFGFIEVGSVTNIAQPGNPRPRLFRLPQDKALINRAGFNNKGAAALAKHLESHRPDCVLGINIGKSRVVDLENAVEDYLASFETVHRLADYLVVNVSSPHTPNLRELQRPEALNDLLSALQKRNQELAENHPSHRPVPLLVKIAPDLNEGDLESIVDAAERSNISGIIATNTTTSRAGLRTPAEKVNACGQGGLSGAPLRSRSTEIVATLYRLTRGRMTIIGCGGVFTAEDAWEKICAGAKLIQLYTGFIYQGPSVARDINRGLAEILSKQGFSTLDEAVGCRSEEFVAA
ncbi:MAG: quinone-dependent dihydroorotate dehydrogenase [Acidobacteriota bacterium]|nr:quinone-dependent dihydroorotate dehydrogenase [Acidobacteriota bacterium]